MLLHFSSTLQASDASHCTETLSGVPSGAQLSTIGFSSLVLIKASESAMHLTEQRGSSTCLSGSAMTGVPPPWQHWRECRRETSTAWHWQSCRLRRLAANSWFLHRTLMIQAKSLALMEMPSNKDRRALSMLTRQMATSTTTSVHETGSQLSTTTSEILPQARSRLATSSDFRSLLTRVVKYFHWTTPRSSHRPQLGSNGWASSAKSPTQQRVKHLLPAEPG